jgi:hypothetical protein
VHQIKFSLSSGSLKVYNNDRALATIPLAFEGFLGFKNPLHK